MRAYSFLSLVGLSKKHNVIDKKIVEIEGVNIENTFSSRYFSLLNLIIFRQALARKKCNCKIPCQLSQKLLGLMSPKHFPNKMNKTQSKFLKLDL